MSPSCLSAGFLGVSCPPESSLRWVLTPEARAATSAHAYPNPESTGTSFACNSGCQRPLSASVTLSTRLLPSGGSTQRTRATKATAGSSRCRAQAARRSPVPGFQPQESLGEPAGQQIGVSAPGCGDSAQSREAGLSRRAAGSAPPSAHRGPAAESGHRALQSALPTQNPHQGCREGAAPEVAAGAGNRAAAGSAPARCARQPPPRAGCV